VRRTNGKLQREEEEFMARTAKRFESPTSQCSRTLRLKKRFGGGEQQLFLHSSYQARTTSISPPEGVSAKDKFL
jgi:transglutaminase-like putative cysteine protease